MNQERFSMSIIKTINNRHTNRYNVHSQSMFDRFAYEMYDAGYRTLYPCDQALVCDTKATTPQRPSFDYRCFKSN